MSMRIRRGCSPDGVDCIATDSGPNQVRSPMRYFDAAVRAPRSSPTRERRAVSEMLQIDQGTTFAEIASTSLSRAASISTRRAARGDSIVLSRVRNGAALLALRRG
jgi:hypothetical protein